MFFNFLNISLSIFILYNFFEYILNYIDWFDYILSKI
jgi:hypothetical protein